MITSLRITHFQEDKNKVDRRQTSDLIEELQERSNIRQVSYKNAIEGYYNQRVNEDVFKVGDYVLRRNEASHVVPRGKIGPTREGPFKIIEAYENRS